VRLPKLETQMQLTRNLLHRAFEGSAKSLVLGALSSQSVSHEELAEIRRMLDEYEGRAQ
jgi:predicted transcriptional regulator